MALNYSDQHLAWKQRISKELAAANRFVGDVHMPMTYARRERTFKSKHVHSADTLYHTQWKKSKRM